MVELNDIPGNTLMYTGAELNSFTPGSILYAGSLGVLSQDNTKLYYDFINKRFGIGTSSPVADLTIKSTATLALRIGENTSALLFGSELVQFDDPTGAHSDWSFVVANNGWPTINLCSTGGTLAAPTTSGGGRNYGELNAWGFATIRRQTANIFFAKDGVPAAGSLPSRIVFRTTPVGSVTPTEKMRITGAGNVGIGGTPTNKFEVFSGNIVASTVGNGFRVREGANAKQGVATLVAGTVVVANTSVTATSRILLSGQNSSGTHGELTVSARVPGVSFTIISVSVLDTRDIAFEIFEPA